MPALPFVFFRCLVIVVIACFQSLNLPAQQIPDTHFSVVIEKPAYERGKGTTVTLDEAHFNFHTLSGRYATFGKVLENDGYVLQPGLEKFSAGYLNKLQILVIANALADEGAWSLPARKAFTKEEVGALHTWVKEGGRLFLIADHMPFPGTAADIASSFGFNFIDGYALRLDDEDEIYSIRKGNLTINTITKGRRKSERIDSIMTFTGQGFLAPQEATVITSFEDDFEILLPQNAGEFIESTPRISGHGFTNSAFMKYGKGKIVVMGEAAMFSAQLAGPDEIKIGMNHPRAPQNARFLLNIIHWLDQKA